MFDIQKFKQAFDLITDDEICASHAAQDVILQIPLLLAEVERLSAQVVAANRTLEVIRDLARTGLAPDALNMTPEMWMQYKLSRVACMADRALEGGTP